MPLMMAEVIRELLPEPGGPTAAERELNELFLELWPAQKQNLGTYRAKPGCSCRGHLQRAMVDEPAKLTTFLQAVYRLRNKVFIKPGEAMDLPPSPLQGQQSGAPVQAPAVARPVAAQPLRHLQGQTRDIADTPEAYSALLKDLHRQGLRFTGLTLRPVGEHVLRVYFY